MKSFIYSLFTWLLGILPYKEIGYMYENMDICMKICMDICMDICMNKWIYIWKYMHENQILHHNPSSKLFMLYNSFDNQGSKINKDDIFFFFLRSSIRKLLSYYTCNKFTSWYSSFSFCIRLCSQLILDILLIYCLNPWKWMKIDTIVININNLKMIIMITKYIT